MLIVFGTSSFIEGVHNQRNRTNKRKRRERERERERERDKEKDTFKEDDEEQEEEEEKLVFVNGFYPPDKFAASVNPGNKPKVNWALSWSSALEICATIVLQEGFNKRFDPCGKSRPAIFF